MHKFAEQFSQYCESTFDLTSQSEYGYQSLSVCLLDCVYSLRARYYDVTIPIVQRYAAKYMNGNPHADGDTVSNLLDRMDNMGHDVFSEKLLMNHQSWAAKNRFPKKKYVTSLPGIFGRCILKRLRIFEILNPRRFWRSSSVQSMDWVMPV